MAERNGYLVIVEQDVNPLSPTYGTTRETEILDLNTCPLQNADWQMVNEYCETDSNGAQTGYKIIQYQDLNTSSPTYLDTYEDKVQDETTCPLTTIDAVWVEINRWCEIISYGNGETGNSGYLVIEYQDMNDISPTFQETKEEKVEDGDTCPAPNTDPIWNTITSTCNTVELNGTTFYDGNINMMQQDINPYSSTFNQIRNEIIPDSSCERNIGAIKIIGNVNNPTDLGGYTYTIKIKNNWSSIITTILLDENNVNTDLYYMQPNLVNEIQSITRNEDNVELTTAWITDFVDENTFEEITLPYNAAFNYYNARLAITNT